MSLDPELRRQMAQAKEFYAHHDYARAEPLLRAIIAQHPGSAEMFNLLGVIQHHNGRFAEAHAMFEQALHLNPGYTEAALNLVVVYNDTGRYEEAGEVYGRAVQRAQKSPHRLDSYARGKLANMHAATAEAYRALLLYDEAVAEYRRALLLCPDFPDLHLHLAVTLSEGGDRQAAVLALRDALRINPRYVEGRLLLGAELYALGERDEARAEWEKALSLDPRNQRAPIYLHLLQQPEPGATDNVVT